MSVRVSAVPVSLPYRVYARWKYQNIRGLQRRLSSKKNSASQFVFVFSNTTSATQVVPRAVDLNTQAQLVGGSGAADKAAARHRERHQRCIQQVCALAREREESQRADQRDVEWRAQEEQLRTRQHIRALESQLGFMNELSSQDGESASLSGLESKEQERADALEARLDFCVFSSSQAEGRGGGLDDEDDNVYHLKAELKEHKVAGEGVLFLLVCFQLGLSLFLFARLFCLYAGGVFLLVRLSLV